jgi:hypothetical protein
MFGIEFTAALWSTRTIIFAIIHADIDASSTVQTRRLSRGFERASV